MIGWENTTLNLKEIEWENVNWIYLVWNMTYGEFFVNTLVKH